MLFASTTLNLFNPRIMKFFLLFFICILVCSSALAQQDTTTINSLKAASSPAGILLRFSPSEISSISDRAKLETEISAISDKNNFTVLPKSFALTVSPFQIFRNKNESKASKNKGLYNLALSLGYRDSSDIDLTKKLPRNSKLALGFSFRFGGKKNYTKTQKSVKKDNERFDTYLQEQYIIQEKITGKSLTNIKNFSLQDESSSLSNIYSYWALSKQAEKDFSKSKNMFRFFEGWAYDVSGGVVLNQFTKNTDQLGAWFTASKSFKVGTDPMPDTKESQHNALIMVRYLKNGLGSKEKIIDSTSHLLDIGMKYTYHLREKNRYFVEFESLMRGVNVDFSSQSSRKWKMTLNIGYEIRKNFVVTAAFGKDYGSNTFNKSGTLFAFLNVIGGLGKSR